MGNCRRKQFQIIRQNYEAAHAARRDAAIKFSNESAEFRQNYIEADKKFNAARQDAVKYVKENGNEKFDDVNYIFPTFVVENMPLGVIGLITFTLLRLSTPITNRFSKRTTPEKRKTKAV